MEEVEKESIAVEGELHDAAARPRRGTSAKTSLPKDDGILFRAGTLERIDATGFTQTMPEKVTIYGDRTLNGPAGNISRLTGGAFR
jgi:hypothetical protein